MNNFSFSGFGQITANVHYNTWLGPNNAWYSPSTGQLYFGDGTPSQGIYDFAREDKVVYHEYTHVVADNIAGISSPDNEEGAISEGNADYFPGSFVNRNRILDYAAPAYERNMANPQIATYSAYLNSSREAHDGGEFWSAVLWDLRSNGSVGQGVADWLVYGALYRITSDPTFLSYRDAMLAEDYARYAGTHIGTVKNVFNARGIGDPAMTVVISGPTNLDYGQNGTWTASVSNASPPYTYEWRERFTIGYGAWSGVVSTSSSYSRSMPDVNDGFELQVKVTKNFGTYVETAYDEHYVYRSYGGQFKVSEPSDKETIAQVGLPQEFTLEQNYPNPFNPTTEIHFALPEATNVQIIVFDVRGREVLRLADGPMEAGYHNVSWNANKQPSGVYFYRFQAGNFVQIRRMLLLK
jgi:hypothetical protein